MSEGIRSHVLLTTLATNWWMVGIRGALAILFGAVLLLKPSLSLNLVVALFGLYAALDGAWAVASALWVSRRSFAGWPVLFEGVASLAVGGLALAWPLAPRELVAAIATWGVLTGALEILAALRLPRERAGAWLLATGGVSSLFLALAIFVIPHAARPAIVAALGVYSVVFGGLIGGAALSLRTALRVV